MLRSPCVLIPSYNESRTIGSLVKSLRLEGYTVYVVDDGSSDETAAIAEREGAVVVKHKVNKGKGASMREGFRHIVKKGFESVMVMDGDGQHEVGDIRVLIDRMRQTDADIIIGNRMSDTSSMPMIRIHTNRFMSSFISAMARQYVPDTQSGFRLIKASVLSVINLRSSNYEIESEMIIRAARAGFRIDSVPIKTIYRDEKSRINPVVDTLRFIFFVIRTGFSR